MAQWVKNLIAVAQVTAEAQVQSLVAQVTTTARIPFLAWGASIYCKCTHFKKWCFTLKIRALSLLPGTDSNKNYRVAILRP